MDKQIRPARLATPVRPASERHRVAVLLFGVRDHPQAPLRRRFQETASALRFSAWEPLASVNAIEGVELLGSAIAT